MNGGNWYIAASRRIGTILLHGVIFHSFDARILEMRHVTSKTARQSRNICPIQKSENLTKLLILFTSHEPFDRDTPKYALGALKAV